MLFTGRELLLQHPFRHGLRRQQDADWVIRVAMQEGVGFEFVPNPLGIALVNQNFSGISNSDDWRSALSWIEDVRQCITLKAYSSYILTYVAAQAAQVTNILEYWKLLGLAIRRGEAKPFHVLLYVGMRLIPRHVRRKLRHVFGRCRTNSCRNATDPAGVTSQFARVL
jgi:hypothetical protein